MSQPPIDSGDELLPTFDFPEATPAPPPAEAAPAAKPAAPAVAQCPCCGGKRLPADVYCGDCGYHFKDPFPEGEASAVPVAELLPPAAPIRLKERYELLEQIGERLGVERFRAIDLGLSGTDAIPVIVVRELAREETATAIPVEAIPVATVDPEEELLPSFDFPTAGPSTEVMPNRSWPSVAWERNLLDTIEHPGLPIVLDTFFEEGYSYIVEEIPQGQSLWDAWDDPDANNQQRFDHLAKVAEVLQTLHRLGAIIEGIRPDIVVINDRGEARITDMGDLLPLPLPADAPIKGNRYTAPELISSPEKADARADLYSFGAMLLALNLGRELDDKQFLKPGHPKPIFNDYPDMHPALGRLMMKTFNRQVEARFPTDEAVKEDKTGFNELIKTLKVCGRTMDQCRLEVAAWTTIGMIRTGNEDAFALLHACESRQDDFADSALIMLADGMGGYDAGEVAAAMCIAQLRKNLTILKPFFTTAGASGFPTEHPQTEGNVPPRLDVEEAKRMVKAALKDANKYIFTASRTPGGPGKRGMGCTVEVVFVDGRDVVVGHVGDSRTYILSEGRLIQMTRDQTLVNRLVELGTLSAEEAEDHPRKNELQQAMGGQPDVDPGIYHARIKPGDFILVCSDGLSNHIKDKVLEQFLKIEAVSAELAARRLVNLVNIEGATDNATVVIVRAT
jgi:protein phosphatase